MAKTHNPCPIKGQTVAFYDEDWGHCQMEVLEVSAKGILFGKVPSHSEVSIHYSKVEVVG